MSTNVVAALECVGFLLVGCGPSSEQARHHNPQKAVPHGQTAALPVDGRAVAAAEVS